MKRLLYRKLSLILILCLAVTFGISEPTFAKKAKKNGKWGKNMTWELKGTAKKHNQTLIVTCNGKMKSLDYVGSPSRRYWNPFGIKKAVIKGNTKNIGQALFSDLRELKYISLKDSIKSIDSIAFNSTKKLRRITLPSNLEVIGNGAFANSGLRSVIFPDKVKVIKKDAFEFCYELRKIKLNSKLKEIGVCAFYACKKMRKIALNNSLKTVRYGAFLDSGIKKVALPSSIEYLGDYSFMCKKLNRVVIKSKKISYFGKKLFYRTGKKKLTIIVPKEKYEEYKTILLSEKRVPKNTEILASKN